MTDSKKPQKTTRSRKKNTIILVLMFLLLATLFLVQCELQKVKENELQEEKARTELLLWQKQRADSLKRLDSLKVLEAMLNDSLRLADSIRVADSLRKDDSLSKVVSSITKKDSTPKVNQDSIKAIEIAEALKRDSLEKIRIQDSIRKLDTIPPEAYLTPPSGRYYEPIRLKVKCEEIKCKTWISINDTTQKQEASAGIEYNKTGDVFFKAEDSLGNETPWQKGSYDMASDNRCGKNEFPVPVKGKTICVDAYEYPNTADEIPKDMVSHEEAAALCEKAGKRLCSIDEWQAACRGKDNFTYSYGNKYHPFKCNTNTNKVSRSGRKDQCRSWFGMYDMNGNLWEWTSTPSSQKANLFLVAGGAWNGQNLTQCKENKFSFYPQNQYPFVGFRCCKEAP